MMRSKGLVWGRWVALGLVTPIAATLIGVSTLGAVSPSQPKIRHANSLRNLPAQNFRASSQSQILRVAEFDTPLALKDFKWKVVLEIGNTDCAAFQWRREERSLATLQRGIALPESLCENALVRAQIVDEVTGKPLTQWSDVAPVRALP
jgi:hypothetical protein